MSIRRPLRKYGGRRMTISQRFDNQGFQNQESADGTRPQRSRTTWLLNGERSQIHVTLRGGGRKSRRRPVVTHDSVNGRCRRSRKDERQRRFLPGHPYADVSENAEFTSSSASSNSLPKLQYLYVLLFIFRNTSNLFHCQSGCAGNSVKIYS